jgi:hypothetical protein
MRRLGLNLLQDIYNRSLDKDMDGELNRLYIRPFSEDVS